MARTLTYWLRSERDRSFAIAAVSAAKLNDGWQVRIKKVRTTDQNRRLFSMLGAIVKAKTEFAGREWEIHDWYEFTWSAFLTEKKMETGTVLTGLSGEVIVIGRFKAKEADVELFGEYMISVQAWLDNHGIEWLELEDPPIPEDYR